MRDPQSIVITGASSGIGAALALAYAGPDVHLAICGRDLNRLEETAALCRQAGAVVTAATVDVANRDAMEAWLAGIDARAGAGIDASRTAVKSRREYIS